jgi:hypothetical protein
MKVTNPEATVALEVAGAKVTLSAKVLAELWIDKVRGDTEQAIVTELLRPPRIGAEWEGGIYMGIVRGAGDLLYSDRMGGYEGDYHLVDLGEAPERMGWVEALAWAKEKGGDLPRRHEQAILFGNRGKDQFKNEWYWSNAQSEGDSSYAWSQGFVDGYQYDDRKDTDYRARAVRRVPI